MNMKRVISMFICLSIVFSMSGCTGKDNKSYIYSGEYFKDMSYKEYSLYLLDTFVSLFDVTPSYKDLGLGTLNTMYGYDGREQENDVILSLENNFCSRSKMPSFYGLLWRTEEYIKARGIDNSDLEKKYGYKHVLTKENVEELCLVLFRKEVVITHGSVAGATYMEKEGVYVYNELIDPMKANSEKGWKVIYLDRPENLGFKWGDRADNLTVSMMFPFWRDEEGNIFDIYGEFIFKLPSPDIILTAGNYVSLYVDYVGENPTKIPYPMFTVVLIPHFDEKKNRVIDISSPIKWVELGMGLMDYTPPDESLLKK